MLVYHYLILPKPHILRKLSSPQLESIRTEPTNRTITYRSVKHLRPVCTQRRLGTPDYPIGLSRFYLILGIMNTPCSAFRAIPIPATRNLVSYQCTFEGLEYSANLTPIKGCFVVILNDSSEVFFKLWSTTVRPLRRPTEF